MAYMRRISYMDLIENEIKRGNAGFIKWEKYDECHILSVFVNEMDGICVKEASVLLSNGHSIGKMNICNGKGEGTYLLARGEKDWIEDIQKIRIILGKGKELLAEFEFEGDSKVQEQAPSPKVQEKMAEPPVVPEKLLEEPEEQDLPEEIFLVEKDAIEKPEKNEPEKEISFWEKLEKTHEMTYPFEDDMGCYRIFPKDIYLLHGNYHGLANNQFLMHGYYNYRHLIIFPKKEEGEYWLGVPGIYHEREKMAARMYGFEKFEGAKKNYRTGDLGYYLITVG